MAGGEPPSLAWHLHVCNSFQPSLPHPSPPEGSAGGCLGAPPRGGGSRSQQRQDRPSEIQPQCYRLLCELPFLPLYLLPRTQDAEPQAVTRRHESARTRAPGPGPGCRTALTGRSPPVSLRFVNPGGGRGPKCPPYPHADPSFPAQPDSGKRLRMFPGLDGGKWDAPRPPSKTPPWPRPCPLSGPSQPEVSSAPVPTLVWGRGLSSPAGRRDE